MTVKQTNNLKQKNLVMEQHNNIKRNIAILDTLLEKHNNLDEITENYSTFPICKIDTTLNTMKYNHIENYITYDGYMYTFKAKGGLGWVNYTNMAT